MNNTALLLGVIVLIIVAGFIVFSSLESPITGAVVAEPGTVLEGEVQQVTLGMRDLNYYPSEITVEADKPVELTLDSSVSGCLRSFTIRELGIVKYSKDPSEKILFMPTKKGSFAFACSMGMGFGTLHVR